jgi:hypothetical protein
MYRRFLVHLSVVFASRSLFADDFFRKSMVVILRFVSHVLQRIRSVYILIPTAWTARQQPSKGGDGLAARCGINGNTFMSYNPGLDCSKLVVDQVSDLPECIP